VGGQFGNSSHEQIAAFLVKKVSGNRACGADIYAAIKSINDAPDHGCDCDDDGDQSASMIPPGAVLVYFNLSAGYFSANFVTYPMSDWERPLFSPQFFEGPLAEIAKFSFGH